VSLVDRKSKTTWLKLVRHANITLISENGKEFAKYVEIRDALGIGFYFAKFWNKGLNEITNGFARQYFLKGSRFLDLTQEDVKNCRIY
jgi:IS30 family transposase